MDKRTREVQDNKRKRMDNKMNLQYDEQLVLSNDYMKEQIAGSKLYKLVSERKKLPHNAKDVWRYNKMRQKDIFSEPLVHAHDETDEAQDGVPDEEMKEQQRGLDGVFDFNLSPAQHMQEQDRGFVLQVDSITEISALHHEAYMLYVKQGMFPWFSSLLQEDTSGASPVPVLDNIDVVMRCAPSASEITNLERPSTPPPRPKRMYSVNDHNVFAFDNLDDEDTPLMHVTKH